MKETKEENIIKKTCKELNLTYKQLAEQIGYGEGAVSNSAHNGKISVMMQHAIKLYRKNLELEKENAILKKVLKS